MTTRTLPFVSPAAPLAAPATAAFLTRAGRRVWALLERVGQLRAAAELARTAALIEGGQPEAARRLREEAAALRAG